MTISRHYFVSTSLDDLDQMEQALEAAGVPGAQVHVLSNDDRQLEDHPHIHQVQSLMKTDLVHSMGRGAAIGLAGAAGILVGADLTGLTQSAAGWMPFVLLAMVILGFSVWEGGLIGIQKRNHRFSRFKYLLNADKHILFVDLTANQENLLAPVTSELKNVRPVGVETSNNDWWLTTRQRVLELARAF